MMKKILFLLAFVCCATSFAQTAPVNNNTTSQFKEGENRKTGNYLEVLSSLYQMTTQNLTGPNKSIAFNGTLFAIKAEADPDLTKDYNFAKETFSRNFQFNFKVNLDENYKYTGFTGGFTYAIINDRDRQLANFMKDRRKYRDLISNYQDLNAKIVAATAPYIANLAKTPGITQAEIASEVEQIQKGLETLHASHNTSGFPADFLKQLDPNLAALSAKVATLRDSAYADIDKAALLTFSSQGSADDKGTLNRGTLGLVFLKGNFLGKRTSAELDFRSRFTYSDTLAGAITMQRTALNSTLGFNFVLVKAKATNKSLLELKAYGEYDNVFKGTLPGEKKDTFLANANLRLRITDNIWLPLTIKYDIEKSNFLGFLNVTYNFDSVSGNSSGP